MKRYCKSCNSVTKHREKGLRATVTVCNKCNTTNMPVSLVKSEGEIYHGTPFYGTDYGFIEWDENDKFKTFHHEPEIKRSVIIDPQYANYTWLTTPITEIESDTTDKNVRCIAFKTKNSSYKLYIEVDESKTD